MTLSAFAVNRIRLPRRVLGQAADPGCSAARRQPSHGGRGKKRKAGQTGPALSHTLDETTSSNNEDIVSHRRSAGSRQFWGQAMTRRLDGRQARLAAPGDTVGRDDRRRRGATPEAAGRETALGSELNSARELVRIRPCPPSSAGSRVPPSCWESCFPFPCTVRRQPGPPLRMRWRCRFPAGMSK